MVFPIFTICIAPLAHSVSQAYEMNSGMEAKSHYFLACVRVKLSNLSYVGRSDNKEKKGKIEKLRALFKTSCNRTDPDNFINAVISKEIFQSMRSDNHNLGTWREAPKPSSLVIDSPSIKLLYGDGFSRVQACEHTFKNEDEHWWVVNLYDQDIGEDYLLSQTYRNSRSTPNLRGVDVRTFLFRRQVCQAEANLIESSLPKSERKELKAIRTRSDLDKALVALSEIPGLWGALKGGLNRTSLLGWDYENMHGLKYINDEWLPILRDSHRLIDVDAETVDNLGGRVPGRSITDRQYIMEQMDGNFLFPKESDVFTRERLKTRILSIKTIIPTMKTYSWDTIHLREIGTILRLLLSADDLKDGPRDIRSALRDIWEEPETGSGVLVEDLKDGVFSRLPVASQTVEIFEIQLQSLVLHVMRNFIKLGSFSPKTISGQKKVQPEKPTVTDLYRFAETARILGFRSERYKIDPNEALRQDCGNFLKKLVPQDLWEYDIAPMVESHCRILCGLKSKSQLNKVQDDSEVRLSQRFGRPTTAVLDGSARYMFLRYLRSEETPGVTSTFVRMEFFRRFWDPVRIVGDFSEVGAVKVRSFEEESVISPSVISPSVYSDNSTSYGWNLREEQEISILNEKLYAAHKEIEDLKIQLERQIDHDTSEMTQKYRELHKDSEAKLAQINDLEIQAKSDKDMVMKLSERDKNISSALEEAQLRIEKLDQQTIKLRHEEQEIRNQVLEKETETEGLKKRVKEVEGLASTEKNQAREKLRSQAKQLTLLQKELNTKIEQLASIHEGLLTAEDRSKIQDLEHLIKVLERNIENETKNLNSISIKIQQITGTIEAGNENNANNENQKMLIDLTETKGRISNLEKRLTDAMYDLLGLKGGEARFCQIHPITKEPDSQIPTRIPMEGGLLEAEFERLKKYSYKYRLSYKRAGTPYTLSFNDFQEWKKIFTHLPVIENSTIFIENLAWRKRGRDESDGSDGSDYEGHPTKY